MNAIVLGSTGAVGTELTRALIRHQSVAAITLLVRREHPDPGVASSPKVLQHRVDVFDPGSYRQHLEGHELAFSTFGVGEPSKVSRDELFRTDLECVRLFARACKDAGVRHFTSLGAVGAYPRSRIHYLRVKGRLEQALIDLEFARASLFRPSMIMTPQNRYGITQALALRIYPALDPMLIGPLRRFRSIQVDELGRAMALNAFGEPLAAIEILEWRDIVKAAATGAASSPGR